MDPTSAFALGVAALMVFAGPLVLWQRRRLARAEIEAARLADELDRRREVMAASPDGLYIWDHVTGLETCSRRLAVLLDLVEGTQARFPDVAAKFPGESADLLDSSIQDLRRRGTAFDILLPLQGGRRIVQAVGLRAGRADGSPLADLLWMRDVTGNPAPLSDRLDGARDSFSALLDALPMPVWLRDEEGAVAFANRASRDGGGAVTGSTEGLAKQAAEAGAARAENLLVTLGDAPMLLEATEMPLEGWAGTLGFAVDRSKAEEMEGEFARHVAARDQALDDLSTAIAIFGRDKRLELFNRAYVELWRLDEAWLDSEPDLGEILAKLREDRRLPEVADFRAFREEQMALFGALGEPAETLLHLPDGTTIRSQVSPHALGGLVFSYEDVTERLALERKYNTLTAVQGETLDNLYEGVAVFGSDGRLKLSNPVFAELWKLQPDEIAVQPHIADFVERMRGLIIGIDDAEWDIHKGRVITKLMQREPSSGRLLRTDGKVVDYANVPLPDGAVLLSYLNVTDSIRVEMALRERTEALQEADRLKSEFIANVSYEIRTPLNTIIGFSDILADQYFGELNKRQQDYIRGIQDSSQGLLTVVNDILDLAAIEAGQMTLELDTVDLHGMLAGVLGLVREKARRKSLALEFDCPPDIGWMVGDEKRLKQVVFNLLGNAVDFTPIRGTVSLEAGREDGDVVIRVVDNGVGIAHQDHRKVFKSFERGARPDGAQAGAGLGLSLVKRFVELHGGKVELRSRQGRGTTVTVRLPSGDEEG